jgi:hypothetical protein
MCSNFYFEGDLSSIFVGNLFNGDSMLSPETVGANWRKPAKQSITKKILEKSGQWTIID